MEKKEFKPRASAEFSFESPESLESLRLEVRERNNENNQDGQEEERDRILSEIKDRLTKRRKQQDNSTAIEPYLLGDFTAQDIVDGKISLVDEDLEDINEKVKTIKKRNRFRLPSLRHGSKTATEYDSQAENWSTKTSIITDSQGRKMFVVNCYPMSQIHRLVDTLGRRLSGLKFSKVSSRRWKKVFEQRSNIPLIANVDDRVVLMPFLDNINLKDLIARNHDIKDFGQCNWAKDITVEDKFGILDQALDRLAAIHNGGEAWGESTLNNMIITKDQKVIICDPETLYDNNVPQVERFASDLRDFIFSSVAAMINSGDLKDSVDLVSRLLERYNNPEVIDELKRVVSKKPMLVQKLLFPFFEQGRLGFTNKKDYDAIIQAILQYQKSEG